MRWGYFFSIITLVFLSFTSIRAQAQVTPPCKLNPFMQTLNPITNLTDGLSDSLSKGLYPITSLQGISGPEWGKTCADFINKNRVYGMAGSYMRSTLTREQYPKLFNKGLSDWKDVCPRFVSMDDNEIKNFWIWFAASVAMQESTCGNGTRNPAAVDGTAMGYYQFNVLGESFCRKDEVKSKIKSNRCFMKKLNDELSVRTSVFDLGDYPKGRAYWAVLRQGGVGNKEVRNFIKEYKPCGFKKPKH